MQSDAQNLLHQLMQIAETVENDLGAGEYQSIAQLLSKHQSVMDQLQACEPFDNEIKPALTQAQEKINALITNIRAMQDDIKKQLSTMNKKKLIKSAYQV